MNAEHRPAVEVQDVVTTIVDVQDYLEAKTRGIRCHVTQVGRDELPGPVSEEARRAPWFGREAYTLARSTVGWHQGVESDLFERVR